MKRALNRETRSAAVTQAAAPGRPPVPIPQVDDPDDRAAPPLDAVPPDSATKDLVARQRRARK